MIQHSPNDPEVTFRPPTRMAGAEAAEQQGTKISESGEIASDTASYISHPYASPILATNVNPTRKQIPCTLLKSKPVAMK